ncbi:MAG TPA: HAD family hydrolase, partial [Candidatus Limnocylindria bacterium]|nr:HAD family hydrolase [Candidatus Limnocylindria bacterium]
EDLRSLTRELVFLHTGKQTIYQCIALAEEVKKRGGRPLDPQDYKDEYHRRLLVHIDSRLASLRGGRADPEGMTVPGSLELLEMLAGRGVTLYLASGTDEHYVREEVALLKLDGFFGGRVYGAQRDYRTFSKKMVIEGILRDNGIPGASLLGFGDGYVEIENVRGAGGVAVGVASNESERHGVDAWKRERLIRAGADAIVPDYRNLRDIEQYLFG